MPSSPSVLFIASHLGLSGSTERLRCCLDSLSQSGTRVTLATPGGCRRDEFAELEVEIVHWRGELSPWQVPFVARRMQKLARAVEADLIYVLGAGLAPLGARLSTPRGVTDIKEGVKGPISSVSITPLGVDQSVKYLLRSSLFKKRLVKNTTWNFLKQSLR